MAVPVDYQQYWDKGNAGIADAMPHLNKAIQDGKPGSPTLQRYIDEFEMRVAKGEDPKAAGDDLFAQWQNDIKNGVQHADVNVPNVGFNQGDPALSNDPMANPAQAPNSFAAPGSFNGLTPPASQMGGGVTGNAAPTQPVTPPSQQWGTPIPTNPTGVMTASEESNGAPEKVIQVPGSPEPTMQTGKIDMIKRPQSMDTIAPPAPPRKLMNRGEQERAMGDIERVKKLENIDGNLEFKQIKLERDSKIKILKAMSNRLTDKEKMDLMKTLQEEGMTLKAQIAVMEATIKKKNYEDLIGVKQEGNRIKANKAANDVPFALKHLWARYTKTADEIARINTSLVGRKNGNPARVKQLKQVMANELHEYNVAAKAAGLPIRTAEDLGVPEVYGDNDPKNNPVDEDEEPDGT